EKLIVGGRSASLMGIDRDGMVRLNPDGSLDAGFDPKIGPEGEVLAVVVQPAGTILLGGSFRNVNGLARYRIAQLNADGNLFGSVEFNSPARMAGGQFRLSTKYGPGMEQIIEASTNLTDWIPIYTNATPNSPLDFIDPASLRFPQRFYRAVMKP